MHTTAHLLAAARGGRQDRHRGVSSTRCALRAWYPLTPTEGLARGQPVEDTGGQLKAPVGKGILARMFDVFGNAMTVRRRPSDVQWRNVHRAPPPLTRRSTKSEIFRDGHQGHRCAGAAGARRQSRPVRRRGRGKTVLLTEMIHNMIEHQKGVSIFCGIGERCREGEGNSTAI